MKFESSLGMIHYESYGNKKNPTIVLFHVLGGDRFFFKKQVEALQQDYHVITWDLPWHGESVVPEERLNFATIEMCFIELVDHLQIDMAVLSGVSLGGLVVQYITLNNPERFKAIHVDGAPPIHLGFNWFVRSLTKSVLFFARFVPKKLLSFVAANILSTDSASKKMIKDHFNTFDKKHILKLFGGTTDEVLKGRNKEVKRPILFTHGENDFNFIIRRCLNYHDTTNHTSYLVVNGGGHLHVKTSPNAYAQALIRFIEQL